MIERDTCGMYQIYFYVNLLNPLEKNSSISTKSLHKRTIEKLLNEMLSTDRQESENRIEQFTEENDIPQGTRETCLGITISFYKKLLASDRFFRVSATIVKESLRPVSESQSLFTRNCWLQTGFFTLVKKMASDEDEHQIY